MKKKDKENTLNLPIGKVGQLADILSQDISAKKFKEGEALPSINRLSAEYRVARDTVFKAFLNLRERGQIDSIPGKGYYVTGKVTNVLLLLDQYTPFKEALYNSFVRQLPVSYKVDILFHQYNERLFNTIVHQSVGKYNKYIVMNFNNEKFSKVLSKINPAKLLLLDFGKFEKDNYSYICQDFDEGFYQALLTLKGRLRNYTSMVFLFPKELKHPSSSKEHFIRFCCEQGLAYEILEEMECLSVRKGVAYLAIKQQDVVQVVKKGRSEGLRCGKDFGLLAYNDIPSYEVIDEGITSMSIDWEKMGNEVADFVLHNTPIQKFLPTQVKLRKSL